MPVVEVHVTVPEVEAGLGERRRQYPLAGEGLTGELTERHAQRQSRHGYQRGTAQLPAQHAGEFGVADRTIGNRKIAKE